MARFGVAGCPRRGPRKADDAGAAWPELSIKCILQKRRINTGQSGVLGKFLKLFKQHHEDQRSGVVVRAVAMLVIGERIDGVLQHPRVIRQTNEMMEPPDG